MIFSALLTDSLFDFHADIKGTHHTHKHTHMHQMAKFWKLSSRARDAHSLARKAGTHHLPARLLPAAASADQVLSYAPHDTHANQIQVITGLVGLLRGWMS